MMEKTNYSKRVILLIILMSVIRLIVASAIGLGNDESYYWFLSQHLKWNYFDHPPMFAVWLRIFTADLLLDKYVIFVRLGSIVGAGLATWFMYKCVSAISNEKAGWFAACLYNASFYAGITAGLFIMPDSPQMVFYTLSLWMMARISKDEKCLISWLVFGIASGLCIMSKVHGVFIWVGFGLYILFYKRRLLLNSRLYMALIIALIIASPILLWNIHYDFLTYRFNSERVVVKGFSMDFHGLLTEILGQFFINNPLNVIFIFIALIAWIKHSISRYPALSIFNFIGLLPPVILLYISVYRTTLPHWSGPAYVSLIPIAAIWLSAVCKEKVARMLVMISIVFYLLFMITCPLVINFYPGTFGNKTGEAQGKGDLTIDIYGWKEAANRFDSIYKKETSTGVIPLNTPLVCNKWWGAHIEYYFCHPLGIPMIGLGEMKELHEYMWTNELQKEKVNLSSAYCVINSNDYYNVHENFDKYYSKIDTVEVIPIQRNGLPAYKYYVFRLNGWKGTLPTIK